MTQVERSAAEAKIKAGPSPSPGSGSGFRLRAPAALTPAMRLNFGGVGEENYSNQSKDNYRGPSTTPLRGFAQDDGGEQTTAKSDAGFSALHR